MTSESGLEFPRAFWALATPIAGEIRKPETWLLGRAASKLGESVMPSPVSPSDRPWLGDFARPPFGVSPETLVGVV